MLKKITYYILGFIFVESCFIFLGMFALHQLSVGSI